MELWWILVTVENEMFGEGQNYISSTFTNSVPHTVPKIFTLQRQTGLCCLWTRHRCV